MKPTQIKISPNGLFGQAVNPYVAYEQHSFYYDTLNEHHAQFEADNPPYPLTQPGDPNKVVDAVLVDIKCKCLTNLETSKCQFFHNEYPCKPSAFEVISNQEETPEVCKTCNGTKEAYKAGSAFKPQCPDCIVEQPVAEQNIEEGANNFIKDYHPIDDFISTEDVAIGFIAGANHTLNKKGLVELDRVVEKIENRIKDIEGNGHTVITSATVSELTDLIKELKLLKI